MRGRNRVIDKMSSELGYNNTEFFFYSAYSDFNGGNNENFNFGPFHFKKVD